MNRMDIEALLNPAEESRMVDDTTDEEICQAVLAAHNAQEEQPIDEENDTPLEPCPTYREVFQAASVISRYAGHVDDPVARTLEAILASFGRQMRLERSQALTTTHITDYFQYINNTVLETRYMSNTSNIVFVCFFQNSHQIF